MRLFERYLSKYQIYIPENFTHEISLIVVIPVLDDPEIFDTLDSLSACEIPLGIHVGIIIVVNHSEQTSDAVKERNRQLAAQLKQYFAVEMSHIQGCVLQTFDLEQKDAGVGNARKTGMDAAVHYFYSRGTDGIIVSLDADTLVESNYFSAILHFFKRTNYTGATLSFEHRFSGLTKEQRESILKYELYMRYYRHAVAYTGHPYAFYCLGSAITVKASEYIAVGGMNRRQAGEDFYFIQKLIATGRFGSIQDTMVYPSGRISERTPFGTGQTVKSISENDGVWKTFRPESFRDLKILFDSLEQFYMSENTPEIVGKCSLPLKEFLKENEYIQVIREIKRNTVSIEMFKKRFYDHFHAFRVLKYLNFVHEKYMTKEDIWRVVRRFAEMAKWEEFPDNMEGALKYLRELDNQK